MKTFKFFTINNNIAFQIFIVFFFLFIEAIQGSNLLKNKDLNYLDKEEKNIFLLKCKKINTPYETANCLNFLGINIYVKVYQEFNKGTVSRKNFINLEKKAINLLQSAIKKGSYKAIKNLAWINSIDVSEFYNLEHSAKLYDSYYESKSKTLNNIQTTKHNKKIKFVRKKNYSNLELALTLMGQIKIYHEFSKQNEYNYISISDYQYAKKIIIDLITKSKIPQEDLKKIKQKVIKNNSIIVNFLKADLTNNDKKFMLDAKKSLDKLKSISKLFK